MATSLTFSHIAQIKDFDGCIRRIEDWKDIHPISEHLEGCAYAIIKGLDEQRYRIISGKTQGSGIEPS